METQFIETYITYTLKDKALNIKENEVMFIPYDAQLKYPDEDIPYQKIKAIYLKKEVNTNIYAAPEDKAGKVSLMYACTIEISNRKSIVIRNYIASKNGYLIRKDHAYETFVRVLIDKLKNYSSVKIYAFEGARAKLATKINQIFPSMMIGGYIITGLSIAKIFLKFLVKTTTILGLGGDFLFAGILLLFLGTAEIANYYFKKNAQLIVNEAIPPHFLPSFEQVQQLQD